MTLTKIVSGGQTGVDRGALDAALAANFECGGWTPADRMAEDGVIPERYPLTPLAKGGYRARTRLTRNLCALEKNPFVLVDAERLSVAEAVHAVKIFIEDHRIGVLNVAGPRASGWADGHQFSFDVVGGVISGSGA